MEPAIGPLLQQHMPTDLYTQSSDHDYKDQYYGHHQQSAYTTGGAVDQLRCDGTAPLQPSAPFSFTPTNTRFHSNRGVASDTSSYQAASNNFTDSSSGSISTSPSSAASSVTYPGYGQPHCTSISGFPGSVQLPQAFAQLPSYASGRVPPILDSHSSGMLPPPQPLRSPISSSANANDREAYANSTPFLARTQLSPGTLPGYPSFADTPRTTLGLTGLSLSNHPNPYSSGHMASPPHSTPHNDCSNFPWPTLEVHAEMTCEGQPVTPEVHAKVEKGFFLSNADEKWTCYRRNYFSVQCHFELHPNITNGRMYLKRSNSSTTEQIQAMGMRLSAAVDGSGGKSVELIQHTPKRDNGPKTRIDITKVSPTPIVGSRADAMGGHGVYPMSGYHATGQVAGPYLPLQSSGEGSSGSSTSAQASGIGAHYAYSASAASHIPAPGQNTSQTFERVQFKQATANNGKRRASQQYFHLIVELYADVRKDNGDQPSWVKVAHRVSEKIVVRGRSPSHYQNEGHHQQQNGRSGSTSGGSGYGGGGGGTFGGLSTTGFRGSTSGYAGGMGSHNYRTNAYLENGSPDHSGSSASSVDGGADNEYQASGAAMSDAERNEIHTHEGYRYYPGPLYEGGAPTGLPLPKIESGARFSTEPPQWAVKYENSDVVPGAAWPSNISRFHGVESSRGYYPDMATTYAG